jgi:oxygen-dependent protoporphyrinogen oxidase
VFIRVHSWPNVFFMPASIVIVGGGITGLSTAYYLAKAGVPSTLIEKRPRLGGVIQTERIDGCLVEGGPDSFLSAKPWAMELISELDLEGEVIGSNDHLRKTFIRKNGSLVPMPDGLQFLIPTRIAPILTSPLLSWRTKARMSMEWFRKPPAAPRPDCSVAEFVAGHYGQEAVDYLAEPLLAGVYGGTPESLGVASVLPRFVELESKYGSLSKGILAQRRAAPAPTQPIFRTLKCGLGSLVDALARSIKGKSKTIHGEVEAIERSGQGYRLRVSGDWIAASQVALACESHASAHLVRAIDPILADQLAEIPYTSSTVVAMGFDPASFRRPLKGFGFLIPRCERRRVVACTFMGTKFPFRVPENRILLRCFVGGSSDDESLLPAVLEELRDSIGLTGDPIFSRVYRWPLSMAQYTVGHQERVSAIEVRLRLLPGLFLGGNAYHGIGIPDCIRMGRQLAGSIVY